MLKFIKEKNGFKSYQAEDSMGREFKIYYGEKDAVAGDNNINPKETIYLIDGEVEIIINNKIETVKAPAEFQIPEKTYHKITALTDIKFLVF